MTTTPTPVERAARAHGIARDARFDGLGDTWDDLTPEDRAAECEDMREALVAAADVDEIARVLYLHRCSIGDYVDGVTAWRDLPESWQDEWRDAARAVVEHLTGATR